VIIKIKRYICFGDASITVKMLLLHLTRVLWRPFLKNRNFFFQGIPLSSAYCSSKGGVLQLTKVMAIECQLAGVPKK